MSIALRPYQERLVNEAEAAMPGPVLASLPTGGGKTVCMARLAAGRRCSLAVAHRQELVGQISLALAYAGVPHRIVAPDSVIRYIIVRHVEKTGASWVSASAHATVAGVDSLLRRADNLARVLAGVELWQMDEAHHVLASNKWGKALSLLPRAAGVGWTATPMRADRQALAREAGGIFERLVQGPGAAELERDGHLAPLELYGPPPAVDLSAVDVSRATGDYTMPSLVAATRRSRIVGDVVDHYLRIAPGKLGVTFAVDVEQAERHAEAFRQRGVPAAAVSDRTPSRERDAAIEALRRGELLQLVNVDIFGEGFDLPAIEVVSLARATESVPLHFQQIGRARRPAPGKRAGVVIDHVGNLRHGLPDWIDAWELDVEPRRSRPRGEPPIRTCRADGCWRAFQSWLVACPYCGHQPAAVQAREPEEVEGDLTLYGPELLERLRQQAAAATARPRWTGPPGSGREVVIRRAMEARAAAQDRLREAIAWWAGVRTKVYGDGEQAAYRRFMATFGVCALTARGLGGPDAERLTVEIWRDLETCRG